MDNSLEALTVFFINRKDNQALRLSTKELRTNLSEIFSHTNNRFGLIHEYVYMP